MNVMRIVAFPTARRAATRPGSSSPTGFRRQGRCSGSRGRPAIRKTAFAAPVQGGWRVRYFAPEAEVPFCGHGARNHVLAALSGLKAGKPVSVPTSRPYGCAVKYKDNQAARFLVTEAIRTVAFKGPPPG